VSRAQLEASHLSAALVMLRLLLLLLLLLLCVQAR
jgi:hypothetical protein